MAAIGSSQGKRNQEQDSELSKIKHHKPLQGNYKGNIDFKKYPSECLQPSLGNRFKSPIL